MHAPGCCVLRLWLSDEPIPTLVLRLAKQRIRLNERTLVHQPQRVSDLGGERVAARDLVRDYNAGEAERLRGARRVCGRERDEARVWEAVSRLGQ